MGLDTTHNQPPTHQPTPYVTHRYLWVNLHTIVTPSIVLAAKEQLYILYSDWVSDWLTHSLTDSSFKTLIAHFD